jgi:hypothetical protein
MQTQLLTLVDPLQVFLDCEVSLNVAFRTLYSLWLVIVVVLLTVRPSPLPVH